MEWQKQKQVSAGMWHTGTFRHSWPKYALVHSLSLNDTDPLTWKLLFQQQCAQIVSKDIYEKTQSNNIPNSQILNIEQCPLTEEWVNCGSRTMLQWEWLVTTLCSDTDEFHKNAGQKKLNTSKSMCSMIQFIRTLKQVKLTWDVGSQESCYP